MQRMCRNWCLESNKKGQRRDVDARRNSRKVFADEALPTFGHESAQLVDVVNVLLGDVFKLEKVIVC
jgi:hypothetical protein